jgi:hypothetical protein
MKKIVLVGLMLMSAGCVTEPGEQGAEAEAAAAGEAALAEAIGDRRPQAPVACVSQRNLQGNRSVGDAIVFGGPGDTIYVNRPAGGCSGLTDSRTLVTRTTSSQLCRGDIATIVDSATGMFQGSCGLGDFTPYSRAR